ncbi:uncharacterized protein LOC113331891 [Papaver somniferum]|uniref:uncharacterized protein LOC113331891 n=1 Tax=Papaver somniferum TaxID=3469 RepID=UPI000E700FA1|nr:uncharacterized protein LOC113331891 [Papaver somniferum]
MHKKEKHLGSPLIIGKSKIQDFEDIKLAFDRRLGTWKGTTMHQAGRTTMVKAVLNSIPTYQMSTFKMPKKMLKKLDTAQRKFWWGFKYGNGTNLVAWQNMCISKDHGGLAFRDLEMLNHAPLTKLAWRIHHQEDHLLSKILKAKYHKGENFLHITSQKHNSSWVWKGIEQGLTILQHKCFMEVNNGKKTMIWKDKWILGHNALVVPADISHYQYTFVSELITPDTSSWNIHLLNTLFQPDIVDKIKNM